MNENKVRVLKWNIKKLRKLVLHFNPKVFTSIPIYYSEIIDFLIIVIKIK